MFEEDEETTRNIKRTLAHFWATNRWPLLVFLLAVVLHVGYASVAVHVDPFLRVDPLYGDARDYDLIAWNLRQGNGFAVDPGAPTSFRAPLYPLFLAGVYLFLGHSLLAARICQAVLGACSCAFVFIIGAKLFGRRTALLAGIGIVLHPLLIYFEAWLITDTLFVFLLTLSILLALRSVERPTIANLFCLGTTLGLSTLTRPQVALLLPLLAAWLFRSAPAPWRQKAVQILLVTVFAALPIVPWTIRNYSVYGELVLISTQGGYTFYGANNQYAFGGHVPGFPPYLPGLSEPAADREYYRLALQWIRQNPGGFVALLPKKLVRLWSPMQVNTSQSGFPLPFAGVVTLVYGLYLASALYGTLRLSSRRATILLLPLVCFTLTGLIYYGGTRYGLPMAPFLVVLAAQGISDLLHRFSRAARLATRPVDEV